LRRKDVARVARLFLIGPGLRIINSKG